MNCVIKGVGLGQKAMNIEVQCYSGYKADERPLRFRLGEVVHEVDEILDRWHGEGQDYFKVRAEDGNIYLLRHELGQDLWELVMFQQKGLSPRHPW